MCFPGEKHKGYKCFDMTRNFLLAFFFVRRMATRDKSIQNTRRTEIWFVADSESYYIYFMYIWQNKV